MEAIQLATITPQPALFKLSSSDQLQRTQLLKMFTATEFSDFSLDNSHDFEVVVRRLKEPNTITPDEDEDKAQRVKILEHALLMPFHNVEAMIKKTASDFGGWTEHDFLSELTDQLDHLQTHVSSVFELEVIFSLAQEMYLCCSADIAPQLKKHALICNQFLIVALDSNLTES